MRLAIFGASGATGRHLLEQALAASHQVTVLVRNPAALTSEGGLVTVTGDARDPEKVKTTIAGQDAVLSALGATKLGPVTICTDAITHILEAMSEHGVHRLIALSAYGAADSRNGSLYNRLLWLLQKERMLDKERMEELIKRSSVDWTLVRPPLLTNGPHTGKYHTGTRLPIKVTSHISRADAADFMLRQVADTAYLRSAATIVA